MHTFFATMTWQCDPVLIKFSDSIQIRWYGLFFAAAFICGHAIVSKIFTKENRPQKDLDPLLWYMVAAVLIGARLGHCLGYGPYFDQFSSSGQLLETGYLSHPLEILKIWHGGLASHGAVAAVFLSIFLFCKRFKSYNYTWLLDRLTIPAMLAAFFIRTGNFFNSEICGLPTTKPWGITFLNRSLYHPSSGSYLEAIPRHPTQLYEALSYLAIFIILVLIYRKYQEKTKTGLLLGFAMTSVFVARFLLEFTKVRQAAFSEGMPLSMGQLLSIPLILIGSYILYRSLTSKPTETPESQEPEQAA